MKEISPSDDQAMNQSPDAAHTPFDSTQLSLQQQLRQLIHEACQFPPENYQRRKRFNQIIRLIQQSRKLWREQSPYYEDALQEMWLHFSRNLCEKDTAQSYNCEQCQVIARLNKYLKYRSTDERIEFRENQQRREPKRFSSEGKEIDPLEQIPAPQSLPPLLDAVRAWVEADETGELRQVHIQGRPDVNCQALILRRLPPETKWRDLATEFDISVATLSSFYEKQCRPRLRQFGESEGYL